MIIKAEIQHRINTVKAVAKKYMKLSKHNLVLLLKSNVIPSFTSVDCCTEALSNEHREFGK